MSVRTVADKYMELCSQGKHFEFMRALYAPEMVSVEGDGREFVGKEPVIHKSDVFQGNNDIHSQDLRGPFFCGDADASSGKFGVYTAIEFSPKSGGDRQRGGVDSAGPGRRGVVARDALAGRVRRHRPPPRHGDRRRGAHDGALRRRRPRRPAAYRR